MSRWAYIVLVFISLAGVGGGVSSPPNPPSPTVFEICQGQDWKQYYRDEYYQLSYSLDLTNWFMISTTHTKPIVNSFPKPAVWANFQLKKPIAFVKYKPLTRDEWLALVNSEQVTGAACDSYIVFEQ